MFETEIWYCVYLYYISMDGVVLLVKQLAKLMSSLLFDMKVTKTIHSQIYRTEHFSKFIDTHASLTNAIITQDLDKNR